MEIDTDLNTLREGDLAIIDTLHISSVREGVFRIHSLVGGQTHEVLTGDEDGAALNEAPQFLVPGIGEGHIAQFDVGGILDVAVGEVVVANGIAPCSTWHIGDITFVLPTTYHRDTLIGEVGGAFREAAYSIVCLVALAIYEVEVERELDLLTAIGNTSYIDLQNFFYYDGHIAQFKTTGIDMKKRYMNYLSPTDLT